MRDEVAPEQFDALVASYEVDPDDHEERLRTILVNGFCALCNAWGIKFEPGDLDPMLKEKEVQEVTPEQAEALLRSRYGA